MAKLKFHLSSGEIVEQNKIQNKIIDLNSYYAGNFVVQTTEYPNGVFCVTGVDILNQTMALSQISCSPDH